jgi:hypothetical protein
MEFSWPKNSPENPLPVSERKLSKEVLAKIDALRGFLPCGDIISDYNYFLEISGRQFMYKKATQEDTETLLNNLRRMMVSWQESLAEQDNGFNEEQKIFYRDIPRYEIEAVDRLISFYE